MNWRRSCSIFVGVSSFLGFIYDLPGRWEDRKAWKEIWYSIKPEWSSSDLILLSVSFVLLLYGTYPLWMKILGWLSRLWRNVNPDTKPTAVAVDTKPLKYNYTLSKAVGWVIPALLLVLLAVIALKPTMNWIQEEQKPMQVSNDSLRTRPICGSTCTNFAWIVEVCKREAVKIGGLTGSPLDSDAGKATRYFRGCLIDKEMNWEICNKGGPKCMRLSYIGLHRRGTDLPSFIE